MTELTRIACPGCRESLRFEPEALDFPATCTACECRFTAGVYVRVACPKCHCGSKIRESYRGQRVRCVRCQHDFVADDGIMPGGGGLLLVARMLDTGLELPPETIQPFLGHAREKAGRDLAPPAVEKVLEAQRLKAEAITERDRFELLAQGLNAELERARAEAVNARRAAGEAEERERDLQERLERAVKEILEAEEESSRLVVDFANDLEAEAQGRSSLEAKVARLDRAARSAMAGEAEALCRLGEFVARSAEISSKTAAELDRERQRRKELARIVEELEAEVGRSTELDDRTRRFGEERRVLLEQFDRARIEAEAVHRADRDRLAASLAECEHDWLALSAEVERLKSEVEAARSAEAVR